MKVSSLILQLQNLNQDAQVYVHGREPWGDYSEDPNYLQDPTVFEMRSAFINKTLYYVISMQEEKNV
jgi:hypothetical protein